MQFDDEISRFVQDAESQARHHTLSFLQRYEIDRTELEGMLTRLTDERCSVYYVSTVPNGLGGSKSDIDFILVPPVQPSLDSVSTTLFYGTRRLGAKVIAAPTIAHALTHLAAMRPELLLSHQDLSSLYAPANVKWEDLERIVVGLSFVEGCGYLSALRRILPYAVARALSGYRQQRLCAMLAWRANQPRAQQAYLHNTLVGAMDAVMSACGRIQSNSKWMLERWAKFVSSPTANTDVAEARHLIQQTQARMSDTAADPLRILFDLDAYFARLLAGVGIPPAARLSVPSDAIRGDFLAGATCIKHRARVAVLSTQLIDQLAQFEKRQAIDQLSSNEAAQALQLLQLELLEIRDATSTPLQW